MQSAAPLASRLTQAPFLPDSSSGAALEALFQRLGEHGSALALRAFLAEHPQAARLVAGLVRYSPFLCAILADDPHAALQTLSSDPDARRDALIAHIAAACRSAQNDGEVSRALRHFRRDMAFLAAVADIGGVWSVMEVTRALTLCADTAVSEAVSYLFRMGAESGQIIPHDPGDPVAGSGYIVLAMGKHGAYELNYSSDIDLIVFFDPDCAPLKPGKEPAPFFVRLTQKLVKLLQERTEHGYVFRTDLRLRPDPGSTAVAISVPAALYYYETIGQTWERSAYIKARPCAGDIKAGEAFLTEMQPFVWRKYLDYAAINEVHAMKRQIHAFKGHEAITLAGHNIKLGRGGIREIEFFVQTQQLIAGGRNPQLRLRDTLTGLIRLTEAKWVSEEQRDTLTEAYLYLRRVEHRLQMVADEQTHSLPQDEEALERFIAFMGYESRKAFQTALFKRLRSVQSAYASLFEDMPDGLADTLGMLDLDTSPPRSATVQAVQKFGFSDPLAAIDLVQNWLCASSGALRAHAAKELLGAFAPVLLQSLGKTGEPGRALLAFDKLLTSNSQPVELLTILRTHPHLLELLGDILGAAPHLAELISRRAHVLDALLEPAFFGDLPSMAEWRASLEARLAGAHGYEDMLDKARIFGQEQQFLVGVRVLSGTLAPSAAGEAFCRLADVLIIRLAQAAMAEIERQHGRVPAMRFALIALGKLGGRENTATSDLDLIVLYDHAPDDNVSDGPRPLMATQYFSRLTQRIIAALSAPTSEGHLYDVDFRLRPSGRSGPVATHIDSFRDYQSQEAWTWEHMALTRARVIFATEGFEADVNAAIHAILTRPRPQKSLLRDVGAMRRAIADDKGDADPWKIKYVAGGLIDIEFIAQTLQLGHAAQHPQILAANTEKAIEGAAKAGLLSGAEHGVLKRACGLYHGLTHMIRVCLDEDFDSRKASLRLKQLLARTGELPDFRTLEAYLVETQQTVRAIFTKVIGRV